MICVQLRASRQPINAGPGASVGGGGKGKADGLAARGESLTLVQGAQQMQAKTQAVQLMTNI